MRAVSFLVDFENAADVAGKRKVLRGWSEGALRAALNRNRMEIMSDPDGAVLRKLLSGSILIRCELARRTTDATSAPGRAPSAIRTPSSCLRWRTRYDMTP